MKRCRECGVEKPKTAFHICRTNRDGRNIRCRDCLKDLRENAPESEEAKRQRFRLHILRTYGLTWDDYLERYYQQGQACAICRDSFGLYESAGLHVDHDHGCALGTVRGLLCIRCNTALGNFRDSIEHLEAAIRYLKGTVPLVAPEGDPPF